MSNEREYHQANSRVSADLKQWIERRAKEERRSQSNFIRKVLEERREREQQQQPQRATA